MLQECAATEREPPCIHDTNASHWHTSMSTQRFLIKARERSKRFNTDVTFTYYKNTPVTRKPKHGQTNVGSERQHFLWGGGNRSRGDPVDKAGNQRGGCVFRMSYSDTAVVNPPPLRRLPFVNKIPSSSAHSRPLIHVQLDAFKTAGLVPRRLANLCLQLLVRPTRQRCYPQDRGALRMGLQLRRCGPSSVVLLVLQTVIEVS